VERIEKDGRTTMILRRGERDLGVLALADVPRPKAAAVLRQLNSLGVKHLIMLTGDNRKVAEQIAGAVGVTTVEADLMPADKLATVRRLQQEYGAVAMVGDGINDAPALATATVGIAMGGAGTAVGLSRASRAIIQQNLVIALGVIALLMVTSVFGWVQLSWAVFLHEGSTVLVALNALRLLTYRLPNPARLA
jgi:Cd2+/Zn2+-exporting ATPase